MSLEEFDEGLYYLYPPMNKRKYRNWRMTSTSHPLVAFSGNLASKTSDLLRSSRNGVCGVPLKAIGRARLGSKKRDFTVFAKVRKVKKHEYPWPEDPDVNVRGGVVSHLSPFKPLKEKQKPVTLDFEKPLMDLQKKIIDVQKMANESGLDFSDQIISLENKYQQARDNIRDQSGEPQLLAWWKNRESQFPQLSKVVRDVLAMQASSVASEQAFSAGRFVEGEHRYSLAKDSMEISVLYRDWVNAERRTAGLPLLTCQEEAIIEETLQSIDGDEGIKVVDETNNIAVPQNVSKELVAKLRNMYFGPYKY